MNVILSDWNKKILDLEKICSFLKFVKSLNSRTALCDLTEKLSSNYFRFRFLSESETNLGLDEELPDPENERDLERLKQKSGF